jgi:hypothetical protein
MGRRGISPDEVCRVLQRPASVDEVRPGRVVLQSIPSGEPEYLLRVFVDVDRVPPEVVTVYRTSRIATYRRQP